MRGLIFVVLLGLAVCDDTLIRKRRQSGWGTSLGDARINGQDMRLNSLSEMIDDLEAKVGNGYDEVPDTMVALEKRLSGMEGSDCPSARSFSCGRHSGQCIESMIVCDGFKDCENNFDESDEVCENPCPAGRSWTGTAVWERCLIRSNNQFSLLITGNKRFEHFRTRLWVDAVIIESFTNAGQKQEQTWSSRGYYDYSRRELVLYPPKGSTSRIGMRCTDAGPNSTRCTFITEGSNVECGTATLARSV